MIAASETYSSNLHNARHHGNCNETLIQRKKQKTSHQTNDSEHRVVCAGPGASAETGRVRIGVGVVGQKVLGEVLRELHMPLVVGKIWISVVVRDQKRQDAQRRGGHLSNKEEHVEAREISCAC